MELRGATWRKSSYSSNGGNTCVEVAAVWRKSSYSSNGGATCVEAAVLGPAVAVRDSIDPDGPRLAFTEVEWDAFLARLKDHAPGVI
jgi:hypothetical protein